MSNPESNSTFRDVRGLGIGGRHEIHSNNPVPAAQGNPKPETRPSGQQQPLPPPSRQSNTSSLSYPIASYAATNTRASIANERSNTTTANKYCASCNDDVAFQESLSRQSYYFEPIWGPFPAPSSEAGCCAVFCTMFCVGSCPCCMPPCCVAPRRRAWYRTFHSATFFICCINILLVIISLIMSGGPLSIQENPMFGPSTSTLYTLQALSPAAIVYQGQVWRLLTNIFLHAGIIHVIMNTTIAVRYALRLEFAWGMGPFLLLYLGSGLLGSIYSAILLPETLAVGASGALSGVMGAWASILTMSWGQGGEDECASRKSALVSVILTLIIIALISLAPFVDWAAHLFGAIGGVALAIAMFGHEVSPPGGFAADGGAAAWPGGVPLVVAEVAAQWGHRPQPTTFHTCKENCKCGINPLACKVPTCTTRRSIGFIMYASLFLIGAFILAFKTYP
jgi:membrane associated rhomboid family serine protease